MERIQVAYVREHELELILVPLDTSFGHRSGEVQHRMLAALQAGATTADLRGMVVPIWDAGDGRMAFLAPLEAHDFLKGITLGYVLDHLNGWLSWGGDTDDL